jgi:ATP-dependent RNA helicase MRH4
MSHSKLIPFTISYEATKDHGDTIYVAGTFTRPEWSLQEMQRQEQDGQGICYHTKITIEPSKEHQYRLKLGLEGDWIVDENKPIGKLSLSNTRLLEGGR